MRQLKKLQTWIEQIARRLYEGTAKQFCRENRIPTSERRERVVYSKRGNPYRRSFNYYFTYDELIDKIVYNSGLYEIIDYAHRKNIDITLKKILKKITQIMK